jgi:hypothetical protein
MSRDAIHHRLRRGRLHPIHRAVYAVGHRLVSREGKWMAAVLAAGPEATLSHRSAAAHLGLGYWPDVEVTARRQRSRPGICVYVSQLPDDEITSVQAIPVTGLSRTLLDLATVLPAHKLERAFNEAEVQRLTDSLTLPDLISRYPNRKGVASIRAILDTGPAFTRSELEARFVAFVREAALPCPLLNADLQGFECDCVWPEHRLIVELDGYAVHRTSAAFERDRARDRALTASGWRVIRVTWRQLENNAAALARDLRSILDHPAVG